MQAIWNFLCRYGISLLIIASGVWLAPTVPLVGVAQAALGGWLLAMDLALPGWIEAATRLEESQAEIQQLKAPRERPGEPTGPNDSCVI